MKKFIELIINLNIMKSIQYTLKYRRKFYVYRKNKTKIYSHGKVQGKGMIIVGRPYTDCNIGGGTFLIRNNAELEVEECLASGANCQICIEEGAKLKVGNAFLNRDTKIYCSKEITMGKHVAISEGVIIRDSDVHDIIKEGIKQENTKPIHIQDNVWIGMGAIILKGVTIGEGSVIGAASVVTRNVPPKSLVVGNPAKIIKENIEGRE